MCILLALARGSGAGDLWIAANRDEHLERPWQPPRLLADTPRVFGGRDLVGGGSWLAVNLEAGFVVGVTNARLGAAPRERSRGRLVLDLASSVSLAEAVALLRSIEWPAYGAFNLLIADPYACWLATNEPAPAITRAEDAAVIAIGNGPLWEPSDRVAMAALWAVQAAALEGEERLEALKGLLADHGGADPLCRHGDRYGTVCSTVLTLTGGEVTRYLFAPGRPCVTPFGVVDVPEPKR